RYQLSDRVPTRRPIALELAWHLACSGTRGTVEYTEHQEERPMKRSTVRWTTAVAAAMLIGLPASGWAQTPPAQQPPAPTSAASQPTTPDEHLRQAKAALDSIEPTAVTGRAKTQIAELKRHLAALEKPAADPSAPDAKSGSPAWATEVAA